mmetsp:Transcript_27474/g.56514  ORF Transcript_27474/g.56514 Transcript_27474/m.56514 type:complete len:134 (+) Transcript_27474:120-521(+)
MNSLELAYHMKSLAVDSRDSNPQTQETLSGNMPVMAAQNFQMDSTRFDMMFSNTISCQESQYNQPRQHHSMKREMSIRHGWSSTLSRSRCVSNLSCLGSVTSEGTSDMSHSRLDHTSFDKSDSWGYYVDSVSD